MQDQHFQQSLTFIVIIFFVGFVLGMGAARIFFDGSSALKDDVSSEVKYDEQDMQLAGKNTVNVQDQQAGSSVFISLVTLARSAWVAVHEDRNGEPANILGARYFPAGKTAGAVELLRVTSPGALYYVIIHADNGDREFDFRNDAPLADSFGNVIMTTFSTFSSDAVLLRE